MTPENSNWLHDLLLSPVYPFPAEDLSRLTASHLKTRIPLRSVLEFVAVQQHAQQYSSTAIQTAKALLADLRK